MSVKLIDNKNHIVIKRDGREEPFSATKLYQVILWACANSEVLANELLEATTIKIYNKIQLFIEKNKSSNTTISWAVHSQLYMVLGLSRAVRGPNWIV